jgi:hypothetical protein
MVKALQYAKLGKSPEYGDEYHGLKDSGDDKKMSSLSKSEKMEQELARILQKNNNKLFVT